MPPPGFLKRNVEKAGFSDSVRSSANSPGPPQSSNPSNLPTHLSRSTNPPLVLSSSHRFHPSHHAPPNKLVQSTRSHPETSTSLVSERARVLDALQREDPSDREFFEKFLKESIDYKLGKIMKGIKQNAREIAELKTAANIEKEAVDLRADIRDVIRRKLMLDIYKDKNWKDPSYVLEVLRSEGHIKSGAIVGRDAVQVVGSVRTEEKSKLKKRLAKCYDLYLTAPLAEFCWHMKTEKSETSVVDGGPELWEAGARWRFVLIELGGLGPNFWLEVDQVLARVEDSWEYYYEDVQKYGQAQPDDSRIVTSYPPSPSENDPANYQLPPETTGQLQQGLYAVDSHGPQVGGDNHDGTVSSNVI